MNWRELLVKDGILRGIYPNPPGGCVIRPRLIISYLDANYGSIWSSIAIVLLTYVDVLVCRPTIIVVDML